MLYIVVAYLWASICLYILLGGADFGAGIVELASRAKHRRSVRNIMYNAIGPIWEANHMWLIIAIVILFAGFPEISSTMSVYMNIPLVRSEDRRVGTERVGTCRSRWSPT